MSDLEKAVKGLCCCINVDGKPMDHNCKECPYAVIDGTCISVIPLMEDALKCLKELWSQVGTMMDLNDKQSEKIVKTEQQFQSMCDLSNMQMETLHEQEQSIIELQSALDMANAELINQGINKTYDRDDGRLILHRHINKNAVNALDLIANIAYDYDGYNSVEGLKSLIDEIREIAIKGVQNERN